MTSYQAHSTLEEMKRKTKNKIMDSSHIYKYRKTAREFYDTSIKKGGEDIFETLNNLYDEEKGIEKIENISEDYQLNIYLKKEPSSKKYGEIRDKITKIVNTFIYNHAQEFPNFTKPDSDTLKDYIEQNNMKSFLFADMNQVGNKISVNL